MSRSGAISSEELRAQFVAQNVAAGSASLLEAIERPMSMEERRKFLKAASREDLIEKFAEWTPRVSKNKKKGAPLDQRVSITVTAEERMALDTDLRKMKAEKTPTTMSQFIRNRAIATVDIEGWRGIAVEAIKEIEDTAANAAALKKRRIDLINMAEEEDDDGQSALYSSQALEIRNRLDRIVAQNKKRTHRLAGRMSMTEAETIKWRAARLNISTSDYLRMLIFALEPNTSADSHMSLDAKRRFYFAIIDVADNGWGDVPNIYNCKQCENYAEELRIAQETIAQLRHFEGTELE